jgi:hypothetical protein
MNKKILLLVAIIFGAIMVAVAAFLIIKPKDQNQTLAIYSVSEVAMHSKMDDCWTIINTDVYDITNYVPIHQGGNEILRTCGANGTTMFTERTTQSGETIGSGTPHSDVAAKQLASYKIGTLE